MPPSFLLLNRLTFVCLILFAISGCHIFRAIVWFKPDLNDAGKFPSIKLSTGNHPFYYSSDTNEIGHDRKAYYDLLMKQTYTNAFLIIKNNKIVYQYFSKPNDSTKASLGYSLAKSFVGTLIGIAIDEGYIRSTNEPITSYIPELTKQDSNFRFITIQQLLDMRSDIDYDELSLGLNKPLTKIYYGMNLYGQLDKLKTKENYHRFEYKNINTQLLCLLLEKTTRQRFIDYFNTKLWQPMGAANPAKWLIDDRQHKTPKAFCGLVASIYDFAKLGSLYLNEGYFNNKQIVSSNWVKKCTVIDSIYKYKYKNHWWVSIGVLYFNNLQQAEHYKSNQVVFSEIQKEDNRYWLQTEQLSLHSEGIYEQYIDIYPEKELVIVRLGNNPDPKAPDLGKIIETMAESF